MKRIIGVLFVAISLSSYAQDDEEQKSEKKVGRVPKDTTATPTYTYDLNDPLVAHYDYQKPVVKDNILGRTEADTTYDLRSAMKFQFTSILANKIGFSYERVFKFKYSWEIFPAYIFANPVYDGISQSIWPNISFKQSGFEIKAGLNLLQVKPYRAQGQKMHSKGIFISYRYQHVGNVNFSTDGKGGQGYYYNYRVSQTKNLIGVFYRNRLFEGNKRKGLESFYEFGFYTGVARTVCFEYAGSYGDDRGEPMKVQSVGMPLENGFVFAPVIRIGMAIRYNKWKIL